MGTGMGTRLYPLPSGDRDETKVWYPLGLGMGIWIIIFYGDGYGSETRSRLTLLSSLYVS